MSKKRPKIIKAQKSTKHSIIDAVMFLLDEAERCGDVRQISILEKALKCFEREKNSDVSSLNEER